MIARGNLHGDGETLADYLIAPGANEDVIARPSPHFTDGTSLHEAVALLENEASGTRAKAGLWHASVSPREDEPYTEAEWNRVWEIYEEEHGIKGHHYVEMAHVKKRAGSNISSEHRHRAYSRVPPDLEPSARPTVVDMKYSHIKNEFIQARAAMEFGREYIPGPNVGTVIRWARDRSDHALADFIAPYRAGAPGKGERRGLAIEQSADRAGRNAAEDHAFIFSAFEDAGGDRAAFEARLNERGLVVERGGRALLVRAQGTDVQYALTRALSAGAKAIGTSLRAAAAREAVAWLYADVQDVPRFTPNDHWRQALENPEHLVTGWLTRRESSFTKAQLETRIASLEPPSMAAADAFVAHVLAGRDVVALRDGRYTTRAMISLERDMTARAALMGSSDYGAFRPAIVARAIERQDAKLKAVGASIGVDQAAAVRAVLDGRGLSVIEGFAGAGKSTTMAAVAEAVRESGGRVIGAAPSGKAARGLADSIGEAQTVAALLRKIARGDLKLGPRDMLVVDEAGMVGSVDMAALVEAADKADARLVLLGDTRQLQAVAAGGAMKAIEQAVASVAGDDQIVSLTSVVRQKQAWAREASKAFNSGDTAAGLAAYAKRGAIRFCGEAAPDRREGREAAALARQAGAAAARQQLIADWGRDLGRGGSSIILAHRRSDVAALNEAARDVWRAGRPEVALDARRLAEISIKDGEDWDGEARTTRVMRDFRSGDRLIFTKNDKEVGVRNGELGTLEILADGRFSVSRDGAETPVVFDPAQFRSYDYGWASTIHAAQGVTVERCYALASATMDQHLALVAATRHKADFGLYVARAEFVDVDGLGARLGREGFKSTSLDYLRDEPELEAVEVRPLTPGFAVDAPGTSAPPSLPVVAFDRARELAPAQGGNLRQEQAAQPKIWAEPAAIVAEEAPGVAAQATSAELLADDAQDHVEMVREGREHSATAESPRSVAWREAPVDGGYLATQGIPVDVQQFAGVRHDEEGRAYVAHYHDGPEPVGYEVVEEGREPPILEGQRGVAGFGVAQSYDTIMIVSDAREAMALAALDDEQQRGRTLYLSTGGAANDEALQIITDLAGAHPGATIMMGHGRGEPDHAEAERLTQLVITERARIGVEARVWRAEPPGGSVWDENGHIRETTTWRDQAQLQTGIVEPAEVEHERDGRPGLGL